MSCTNGSTACSPPARRAADNVGAALERGDLPRRRPAARFLHLPLRHPGPQPLRPRCRPHCPREEHLPALRAAPKGISSLCGARSNKAGPRARPRRRCAAEQQQGCESRVSPRSAAAAASVRTARRLPHLASRRRRTRPSRFARARRPVAGRGGAVRQVRGGRRGAPERHRGGPAGDDGVPAVVRDGRRRRVRRVVPVRPGLPMLVPARGPCL